MARIRTFVALDLSQPIRRQLKSLLDHWGSTIEAVRWVPADQLHLTLKFLGEVDERASYEVCRRVGEVVQPFGVAVPLRVRCAGLGAFPDVDHPRTVWIGVEDRQDQLGALQRAVDEALFAMGFAREGRAFVPHITLGRVKEGHRRQEKLRTALDARGDFDAGIWEIADCTVYASRLTPRGPEYQVLGRLPFNPPRRA